MLIRKYLFFSIFSSFNIEEFRIFSIFSWITSFKPGTLEPGRNYYWRVDEVSSTGTRTGFTWRFTTRE